MVFTTALYLRLSVDDEKRDESASIANQRDLLMAYIKTQPTLAAGEILTFADDGWSGTNFERPQVKALLDLARSGGIQCIVVKDLSRWSRSYPETSEYLDQIFPFLGIRFISLGENYDSDDHKGRTVPMDVAFKALVHDIYCKELSLKQRQTYDAKTKNGEFLSGAPPFEFVKSKTAKNRLELDDEAAAVVRRIFGMACDGTSNTQIAAALNSDGVDTPQTYRNRNRAVGKRFYWTSEAVKKLLVNERYMGNLVGGRHRISRIGISQENEVICVQGAFPAIVSEDVFKQANDKLKHRKAVSQNNNRPLYSGKVKCGCCGRTLRHCATKKPYFFCIGAKVNGGMGCFSGRLLQSDLSEIVLAAAKAEVRKFLDIRREPCKPQGKGAVNAELKKLAAQAALLERRGISLFEDYADGKLSKAAYKTAVETNKAELEKVQAGIVRLNERIADIGVVKKDDAPQISALERVLAAESVTPEVLALVDRITVYDAERIEVQFAFGDTFTAER